MCRYKLLFLVRLTQASFKMKESQRVTHLYSIAAVQLSSDLWLNFLFNNVSFYITVTPHPPDL